MSEKHIRWLLGELSDLVEDGTIDMDCAERIKSRYPIDLPGSSRNSVMTLFALFGVMLVLLGIIVLMAFNWQSIPRAGRVSIAFVPLLLSHLAVLYTFGRKYSRPAWREGGSIASMLSFVFCTGLLSQIYQISGSPDQLFMITALISLPVIYVLRANGSLFLYLCAITAWAAISQYDGGNALWYWPLFVAIIPRVVLLLRSHRLSGEGRYVSWLSIVSLSVGLGISLEKTTPGLWIVVYALFFAVLSLISTAFYREHGRGIRNPFGTAGFLGMSVLGFMLTYSWPWQDIGWLYSRETLSGHQWVKAADYIVLGILFCLFVVLVGTTFWRKWFDSASEVFFALLVTIAFILTSAVTPNSVDHSLIAAHLMMNAGIFLSGVFYIVWGYHCRRAWSAHSGALIICVLICLRFIFVEGFFENMIVRGLIFIGLGIALLVSNYCISRSLLQEGTK